MFRFDRSLVNKRPWSADPLSAGVAAGDREKKGLDAPPRLRVFN
jgi:hypothetical protein